MARRTTAEIHCMARRTMADVHRDEGRDEGIAEGALRGRKETLLEQIGERWVPLPPEAAGAIEAARDVEQVKLWLRRFATAPDLASVGILPR